MGAETKYICAQPRCNKQVMSILSIKYNIIFANEGCYILRPFFVASLLKLLFPRPKPKKFISKSVESASTALCELLESVCVIYLWNTLRKSPLKTDIKHSTTQQNCANESARFSNAWPFVMLLIIRIWIIHSFSNSSNFESKNDQAQAGEEKNEKGGQKGVGRLAFESI